MAMYYYARKIQRAAAKKAKSPPPSPPPAPPQRLPSSSSNGTIPNSIINQQKPTPNAPNSSSSSTSSSSTNSTSSSSSATTTTAPALLQDNLNNSSITNGARSSITELAGACSNLNIQSAENNFVNSSSFQGTTLVSGIQHLVPTSSYYPDRAYIFAFLLTSRLHIAPSEVLGTVFRPVLSPSSAQQMNKYKSPDELKVASLMVQLLGEWTEMFPYDFRDEKMMAHVRNFTEQCVGSYPHVKEEVSELLTSLLARLEALERYEAFLHRLIPEIAVTSPLTSPSILTICPTPVVLAQQLTHIEIERLGHVGAEEFLHGFPQENAQIESGNGTGTSSSSSSGKFSNSSNMKKTRNLEAYLQWHYRLTFYVATEVCKVPKRKARARVIEHWIETGRECLNIGNFNSLMAIIMGLNLSPVERLKKTWAKVHGAQLSELEKQMSPSENYRSYRILLHNSLVRTPGVLLEERHQVAVVVVPCLPLFLKDISVTIEECGVKLFNGQINFGKFWQLAKQVTEFIGSQQMTCPFPKVQPVISSLQTFQIFPEPILFCMSYELESPNNRQEKEHFKSLQESNNKNDISTNEKQQQQQQQPKASSSSSSSKS